jgi:hypothetical protein
MKKSAPPLCTARTCARFQHVPIGAHVEGQGRRSVDSIPSPSSFSLPFVWRVGPFAAVAFIVFIALRWSVASLLSTSVSLSSCLSLNNVGSASETPPALLLPTSFTLYLNRCISWSFTSCSHSSSFFGLFYRFVCLFVCLQDLLLCGPSPACAPCDYFQSFHAGCYLSSRCCSIATFDSPRRGASFVLSNLQTLFFFFC